jgi:hypothetical protein
MDLSELLKGLATQSFGAVLAYIFFRAYQKEVNDNKLDLKEVADKEKYKIDLLLQALMSNTKAITENTMVLNSLHRRLDNEGDSK